MRDRLKFAYYLLGFYDLMRVTIIADYGINILESYSIGDHPSDYHLAEDAGGKGIYVLTGHGKNHLNELPDNALTVKDIGEAANIILAQK